MNTTQTNYISNPFKVIFAGFGNMFKYNQHLSIILLIASLFMSGGGSLSDASGASSDSFNPSHEQVIIILIVVGVLLLALVPLIIFLSTMYYGIASYTALKTARHETTTFKEAWNTSLRKFWTILGINIIVGLKVLGGLLLFIIPGIRAMLRYNMVHMFVFDENTGVKDSVGKSKELAKDHLIEIFGMTFAAGIIPIVGGLMQIGGQSVMYPQLRQLKSTPSQKPHVHWLNYLAFVIFSVIFGFIALLVVGLSIATSSR